MGTTCRESRTAPALILSAPPGSLRSCLHSLFALALIEDPDSFRPPSDSNKLNTKKQDRNLESFDFFDVLNFEQSALPAPSLPHLKARTRNHQMARGAAATTRSSSGAAAAAPAPEEVGEFFLLVFSVSS